MLEWPEWGYKDEEMMTQTEFQQSWRAKKSSFDMEIPKVAHLICETWTKDFCINYFSTT